MLEKTKFNFILISALLITTYFNPDLQDPFNSPKMWILFISSFWILGSLISFRKINKDPHERYFKILIVGFLVSTFIASILTDIHYTAFFGDAQRRIGFLTYLCLVIFLYATYKFFRIEHYTRMLNVTLLIAIILVIYGTLQTSGKDFIAWNNPYNAIILTFGNPNFASAFMAMLAVLLLTSINLHTINSYLKVIMLGISLFLLGLIVLSNSRQGLVGFSIGFGFFLGTKLWYRNKRAGLPVIFFLLFFFFVLILGMLQFGPLKNLIYKPSLSVRGFYWQAAWEMFKSNPLFGIGIERYGAYFKEYREIGYPLNYGFEITSTNAHNVFLQMFATGGFFVGFFYLALTFYIFYRGLKKLLMLSKDNNILLPIFSSWLVFQSQSVISIDNIGLTVWGWILGGCILALSGTPNMNDSVGKKVVSHKDTQSIMLSWIFSLSMIILVSFLYRGETATMQLRERFNGLNSENNTQVFSYAENALNTRLLDPNYKNYIVQLLIGYKNFGLALQGANDLVNYDPRNQDYLLTAAYLAESTGDYNSSIGYREEIQKYDPYNADNLLEIARSYLRVGDKNSAAFYYNKITSTFESTEQGKIANQELSSMSK